MSATGHGGSRLSPQQRQLLSHADAGPIPPLWVACLAAIRGELDAGIFERALRRVVAKYEILRTTFVPATAATPTRGKNGLAPRIGASAAGVAFAALDLSASSAGEQDAQLEELYRAERRRSFDLELGPLLGATLVRRAPDRHALLIAAHALCADRTSLTNLVRELCAAYASLAANGPFDDDALQYSDIVAWQLELQESEDSRPGVEYWRRKDFGDGAGLSIPFESPTPAAYAAEVHSRAVDGGVARCVAEAAKRLGVTRRVVCLAAWAALLRRLAPHSALLLGVGVDGRRYDELAEPLGPLARTLPLPLHVANRLAFAELLRSVARELQELERWQECCDPALVPELASARARPPFGFDYTEREAPFSAAGLAVSIERLEVSPASEKCRLSCRGDDTTLETTFVYDRNRFGPATIERLAGAYEALLASAAARPEQQVGRLDALAASERRQLLDLFNDTDRDHPRGVLAHEAIEEHAARTPAAVALRQGDRALTYGELDLRANQLAWQLRELGVGPDTLVALCIERSFEMLVGILGILKAGGAYVPVDPAYPEDRIRFLVEDTRAPVLLTQERLLGRLPETDARVVCVEHAELGRRPTGRIPREAGPENFVYVIYTSGSTGKPKGVVITHEKLVVSNTARIEYFGHTPETFLLLSSVAFDSSVVGIFWTLAGGGTLILVPEGVEKDVGELPRLVREAGVTHLLGLPSFYRLILEQAREGDLASLRTVIVAGEACPLKMVEHHRRALPGVGLFSEYGATETTVFSSVYDCLEQEALIAPLGTPIDNARMYVLDSRLEPCPTGVPGEVHFGGTAIALGYWRRPELTAERFVPDPFGSVAGRRLYKSGDLARHLENGDIEFQGRIDNQVKIRGYRVELEEIEVALLKHPAVKEAAVLALADLSAERRLVGYVVPEGAARPGVGLLRDFLRETLPDYMVPAVFVVLTDFPRTPNGKLDRKALPEPGSERPDLDGAFEAPSTPAEARLAAIWADVLGLDRVGVRDNFFELGGDSILSIQIVARAKRAGILLTPRQLFENQTVSELAAVARTAGEAGAAVELATQGEVTGAVPLTAVQRWFFELDLPEPDHWNMPVLLEVRRRVTAEDLERALRALLAHHDVLRARFRGAGTERVQEIAGAEAESGALVFREDLSGVAREREDAELAARADMHHAALDLVHGPLVRAVLIERGAGRDQLLLWIVHHLLVDGVSWRILIEDLDLALAAVERGEPVQLPPKTTSFRRWSERLSEHARAPERRTETTPWLALAGRSFHALPLDLSGGRNVEAFARKVSVELDAAETRALLSEVPKAYHTRIDEVLLTALTHAVAEWTGEEAVLINLEGHGREEVVPGVDLSRTVGWFTTDYPALLHDTRPFDPSVALRAIKEELRAIPEQGFGYGMLRHLADEPLRAELARLPRPSIGFNYLGQYDQALRADDRFRFLPAVPGHALHGAGERVFVLEVYGQVAGGKLVLDFEYGEKLHERATIERLAVAFLDTLRALVAHCLSGDAGGFTTSDFADFAWSASDLEGIADAIRKSEEDEGARA